MPAKAPDSAIALATLIAAGTSAYGDAIRFDNDGSFRFIGQALDITLPADQQTGFQTAAEHSIEIGGHVDKYFTTYALIDRFSAEGGSVDFWSGPGFGLDVDPLDAGALIGSELTDGRWLHVANFVRVEYPGYYYGKGGTFSPLDAGIPSYIGLRVDLGYGDGFRYGWVGVLWDPDAPEGFGYLDAFAWGYETQAGASIAAGVPAPSGVALLAFGAAGALSRKRTR